VRSKSLQTGYWLKWFRDEVEENLMLHAERLAALNAERLIEDYRRLIKLTNPRSFHIQPTILSVQSAFDPARRGRSGAAFCCGEQAGLAADAQHQHFTKAVAQKSSFAYCHAGGILSKPFGYLSLGRCRASPGGQPRAAVPARSALMSLLLGDQLAPL